MNILEEYSFWVEDGLGEDAWRFEVKIYETFSEFYRDIADFYGQITLFPLISPNKSRGID